VAHGFWIEVSAMNMAPRCRICQAERRDGENWFLLIDNDWEDRLKILLWCDELEIPHQVYAACSPSHVQKLAAHWMATGSLEYPFGRTAARLDHRFSAFRESRPPNTRYGDLSGIEELGELAVDRDSLHRLLLESPDSLVPVLDALISVLPSNSATELEGFSLVVDDVETSEFVQLRPAHRA
jgi:hypothetical protein